MKKTTVILIIVCTVSLLVLLYPSFSNYWNEMHATRAIYEYASVIDLRDREKNLRMLEAAEKYNRDLALSFRGYVMNEEQERQYRDLLDPSGSGVMGYLEIPKLGVLLPIQHGTSNDVLQGAVGHIDWTSLPVGGKSTHTALSGHRGLPSARLFTDLDKLTEGDIFVITVLDRTLTYEVDRIRIVLPNQLDDLMIEEGEDYCTLVTCTPYGINTHRLLVRGKRTENLHEIVRVVQEGVVIDPFIIAPIVGSPLIIILVAAVMFKKPVRRKKISAADVTEAAEKEKAKKHKRN